MEQKQDASPKDCVNSISIVDPQYEFRAPKFYDFTKGDDNSSVSGDSFFDRMETEQQNELLRISDMRLEDKFQENEPPLKKRAPSVTGNLLRPLVVTKAPFTVSVVQRNRTTTNKAKPFIPRYAPSPTVGVSKVVPQPATEPRAIVLRTQERALVKRQLLMESVANDRSTTQQDAMSMHDPKNTQKSGPTIVKPVSKAASCGNVQGGIHPISQRPHTSGISVRSGSQDLISKNETVKHGIQNVHRGLNGMPLSAKRPLPKQSDRQQKLGVAVHQKRQASNVLLSRPAANQRPAQLPQDGVGPTIPKANTVNRGVLDEIRTRKTEMKIPFGPQNRRDAKRNTTNTASSVRKSCMPTCDAAKTVETAKPTLEEIRAKKLEALKRRTEFIPSRNENRANANPKNEQIKARRSVMPATIPVSPKFATDLRLKQRMERMTNRK